MCSRSLPITPPGLRDGCRGTAWLRWVFAALLFARLGAAGAQEPERLLVLAVTQADRLDPKRQQVLTEFLEHSGEAVVERPRLSTADRRCSHLECLTKLASRTRANLIFSVQIEAVEEKLRATVWLFDARTATPQKDAGLTEEPQLEEFLKERMARLLKSHRAEQAISAAPPRGTAEPAGSAAPEGVAAAETKPPPPPPSGVAQRKKTLPTWRKGLAWTLGGAAAAGLLSGVVLTVLNHRPTGGVCGHELNGGCVLDTTGGYAASYAASGVLLVGVGLAVGLPR